MDLINSKYKLLTVLEKFEFKEKRYRIAIYTPDGEYDYVGQISYFIVYDTFLQRPVPFTPIYGYLDECLIEFAIELNAIYEDDGLYLDQIFV